MADSSMKNDMNWMRDLAFHYEAVRRACPHDRLLVVFDIDGTIVDTRCMIAALLHAYDRVHKTDYFRYLQPADIHIHENEIETLLSELDVPRSERGKIIEWYILNFWSQDIILQSHRPFDGVLDVIRWFQLQPNTSVGLNTGRSEHMREDTLKALNLLGSEYRVEFPTHLLHMNAGHDVAEAKVEGLRTFMDKGYRIVAMIDNEPENLKAVADADPAGEILLLHADTIFASAPAHTPLQAVAGSRYDITELVRGKTLPKHVEFVWHGVDDESILRQFLVSNVHWAELHVRLNPLDDSLIIRRKNFSDVLRGMHEEPIRLEYFLSILRDSHRGIKIDVKDEGILCRVMNMLKEIGFAESDVWISLKLSELNAGGLKAIMKTMPGCLKQCPVDALARLITDSPAEARRHIGMCRLLGIDRFSVNWKTPGARRLIVQLQNWGHEVNVYNVQGLESFLQAALLFPRSITSYFNFPKWFYTGHDTEETRIRRWDEGIITA